MNGVRPGSFEGLLFLISASENLQALLLLLGYAGKCACFDELPGLKEFLKFLVGPIIELGGYGYNLEALSCDDSPPPPPPVEPLIKCSDIDSKKVCAKLSSVCTWGPGDGQGNGQCSDLVLGESKASSVESIAAPAKEANSATATNKVTAVGAFVSSIVMMWLLN